MQPGIHLIHKPVGPSSFAALRSVAPPDRRSCHGGVLDPFASGLLLVLIEPATQLFDLLHDVPKVYDATIAWGVETDTGDSGGKRIAAGDATGISPALLDEAILSFLGWHDQIPPATSNKRIDGERAYVRAHRGEDVQLPAVRVYLHAAEWRSHDLPRTSVLRLTVRGGFYVRSLIRDLGRRLACGAHVSALHRLSIGPWLDPGRGKVVAVPSEATLPWLPTRILSDTDVRELKMKRPIDAGEIVPASWALPDEFPAPPPRIRGVHLNRFIFLLEQREMQLYQTRLLRGGI